MPMFLYAHPAVDEVEEQKIRKLAGARHASADRIQRAKIITLSWAGLHTTAIAARLGCHAKTVRQWLHRFNAAGLDGLGDKPIPGRPRRLSLRFKCPTSAESEVDVGRPHLMRCCVDDEGLWPFGVALRGEMSNHLKLRWLKTVVVSVEEKA